MKTFSACKRGHFTKKLLALDKIILETQFNMVQSNIFRKIIQRNYNKYIHTTAHLVNTRESDVHGNHVSLCFEQLRPSNIAHCSEFSSWPHCIKQLTCSQERPLSLSLSLWSGIVYC